MQAFRASHEKFDAVGPFAFGKELTLADAFIVAQMYNARRFEVDLSEYPLLVAIEQHCLTLGAF